MTMRERTEQGKLFTDYCEGLPETRLHCKKQLLLPSGMKQLF